MKVFFDTSILIAASLEEHEHHPRALAATQAVHEGKDHGFVSAHSLLEMHAVLTRLPRSPRVLPLQAAALVEANVLDHFTVVMLSAAELAQFSKDLGRRGIVGGQVYDALHLQCAEKCGADRVFTFNLRHFRSMAPHLAARITVV
jgi:predicted nucleic acid-binding protein